MGWRMQHLVTLDDWTKGQIVEVLDLADALKREPHRFYDAMRRRILLMIFEKPSLRTRVSFESGMSQMGGHAINYDTSNSPFGAGKESVADMARVASRFVDMIMARLYDHAVIEEMHAHAAVPVINALTDRGHPCQVLADFQTIRERKGRLEGLTLAYLGDAENNVTYSLIRGCVKVGMNLTIGCPDDPVFRPDHAILEANADQAEATGSRVVVSHDAVEAARDADIVYTDSWMSYHIPKDQMDERIARLSPFQVNETLMRHAKPDAIFMNCLPAIRGMEQTATVIDGPQSVVFDEAENRLHAQKAVMIKLLEWSRLG